MNRGLTPGVSLDALKREAKRWQKALLAGDAQARARFVRAHFKAPAQPGLREVQHALARERGFGSWAALKRSVLGELTSSLSREQRIAEFLRLACLSFFHDQPARQQRALKMLEREPELARASIHTAAVTGDLECIERLLRDDPGAATRKGGPQDWEPLLFVCYSRLPLPGIGENALAIARLLLDHGASAKAEFLMNEKYRFTALCGALGGGDAVGPLARPPHPRVEELAALLLERGADPRDGQAMYDTMLTGDDPHWLEVLIEHGLDARYPVEWQEPAETSDSPRTLFDFMLGYAVERNQLKRARVLLAHGADPRRETKQGLPYVEAALRAGHAEMAELLVDFGASARELGGADAFRSACLRAERRLAARLLEGHPEYLEDATLLGDATRQDRAEIVAMLLDFGMSPNVLQGSGFCALHVAACNGAVNAARVLVERGAEIDVHDPGTGGSVPLGWALYTTQPAMIELLVPLSRDAWCLVAAGRADRLAQVLAEDATALRELPGHGGVLLHHLPEDTRQAEELVDLLLAHGADVRWRDEHGQTPALSAERRGSADIAELLQERGG